jgi:UDP-glucose 4-epimerase
MKAETVDTFYNVGTGKRTSLKELAEKLLVLTNFDKEIQYAPRSQATLVRNRIGSPKKAAEEIGFNAQIDLNEGLKRLIQWRASHKAEVSARRLSVGLPA